MLNNLLQEYSQNRTNLLLVRIPVIVHAGFAVSKFSCRFDNRMENRKPLHVNYRLSQ